jgi:hypothetical protein
MYSLDFLYYALGVGFLILIGFICYVLYQLGLNLRETKIILSNVRDITTDVNLAGSQIKLIALNFLGRFFGKKGGERNDRKRSK